MARRQEDIKEEDEVMVEGDLIRKEEEAVVVDVAGIVTVDADPEDTADVAADVAVVGAIKDGMMPEGDFIL